VKDTSKPSRPTSPRINPLKKALEKKIRGVVSDDLDLQLTELKKDEDEYED
jgi:hypothetical protein